MNYTDLMQNIFAEVMKQIMLKPILNKEDPFNRNVVIGEVDGMVLRVERTLNDEFPIPFREYTIYMHETNVKVYNIPMSEYFGDTEKIINFDSRFNATSTSNNSLFREITLNSKVQFIEFEEKIRNKK